jgi:hypothetical protein
MVVRDTLQCAEEGVDGRLGLLRVAAELAWQVVSDAFAQGKELAEGFVVALVELVEVQGGVAGSLDLISGAVEIEYELRLARYRSTPA